VEEGAERAKKFLKYPGIFPAKWHYSMLGAKCFRLQDVILPHRAHVAFIANDQNWHFAVITEIPLKKRNIRKKASVRYVRTTT